MNERLQIFFKTPNLSQKTSNPLFIQLEGSIWDIFQRIKKRSLKNKKDEAEETLSPNAKMKNHDEDETSWAQTSESDSF